MELLRVQNETVNKKEEIEEKKVKERNGENLEDRERINDIKKLKIGKVSDIDGILLESWKCSPRKKLEDLMRQIWKKGET